MQLNNTTQYAIRIVSYIADQKSGPFHSGKELAEVLNIPYKFLTKIMGTLAQTGIVRSIRGREGGYELNKPASEIVIADILDIFNDSLHDEQCVLGIGLCDSTNKCALHDQWIEPRDLVQKMFRETTIAALAEKGYNACIKK
ncbi:MAG: Rrf2 family transcriptional regulator [Thiovulaceae bacterium]|nr:Rrf2 family transcriptional regulator [Sulfurimonadaceae bacterium]